MPAARVQHAFGHAALVLGDDRYLATTRQLVTFIEAHLVREGSRLWRTARAGRSHTPAFAEDYFAVADGLLVAHAALGEGRPLQMARSLVDTAVREFWDDEAGTFVDTSGEHDRTVAQPRGLIDNASSQEHQIALLWQAIEKLSAANQQAKDCVPCDAAIKEQFEAGKLNELVGK